MPSGTDYLPNGETELVLWYANFHVKLPNYSAALGLVPGDLIAVVADYQMLEYIINDAEIYKNEAKERVQYKDIFMDGPIGTPTPGAPVIPAIAAPGTIPAPGIIPRLRALVRRIKANPAYSTAMGQDLGLIAPDPNPGTPKPTGSARAVSGSQVEIKFKKGGFAGVLLESRRNAEAAWTSLGIIIASPYTDTRPPLAPGMPEVRYYRMRYVQGNSPTGEDSDILQVTTIP